MDFTYSNLDSKSKDESGTVSNTKTSTFRHQYSLNFMKNFYPNLRLLASCIFDQNRVKSDIDDTTMKNTTSILKPVVELRLNTPLYSLGLSYNKRETEEEVSDSPSITNVSEEYNGIFGWRPDGFPSIDIRLTRVNNFDKEHSISDSTNDMVQLTSVYELIKDLTLRYQLNYDKINDKLNNLENNSLKNSGKISYDAKFFYDRVTLYSSYDVSRRTLKTSADETGKGTVSIPLIRFAGLAGISDNPANIVLKSIGLPALELIDGNTESITATTEVNIGLTGDTKLRNIGIDFGGVTTVNNVLVWVNRELPSKIAKFFLWDIYKSSDNENWTLVEKNLFPAPFGPFENRFEIDFPEDVKARYIKVVVSPLTPAEALSVPTFTEPDKIFITEIEAFLKKSPSEVDDTLTTTNQIYNLNTRVKILEKPFLFYDLSYFLSKTEGVSSVKRSTLSNGLILNHRFNKVFSTDARVAREDGVEDDGDTEAFIYNLSLNAVPLNTLSHNLNLSKRTEKNPEGKSDKNNIYLYNTAELYKGINTYLSLGYNFSELETNRDQKSTNLSFGTNIIPHETLTLNLSYSSTDTEESGGGKEKTSTASSRTDFIASYRPFRTLYIVMSFSKVSESEKDETLQNYGVNWSPFPDGDLQFHFEYNQSLRSQDKGVDTIIRPGLRWNINKRTYLDISYLITESDTEFQKTESKIFNANLRVSF